MNSNISIFIWAAIEASYSYFGEDFQKEIEVNEILSISSDELPSIKDHLIDKFGTIEHEGHIYVKDKVSYKCTIKAINRI